MEGTFLSLVPPLVAIVLCIYLREAIISLFVGVYVGALFLYQFNPFTALYRTGDQILVGALSDTDHIINLMFTVSIGGLVEIFNRSPSTQQIFASVVLRLKNRMGAGLAVWISGLVYFIDDYANSLIVGNAYRKVMDMFRISRAKLAFLVDTTSAPITSIALVSTWIGFEVSLLSDALESQNITDQTGLGLFLVSIPYRFYPILALAFSLWVVLLQRDFGPMLKAEQQSYYQDPIQEENLEEDVTGENHPKIYLALLPIVTLILCSFFFLTWDGYSQVVSQGTDISGLTVWQLLFQMLSEADTFRSLLWSTMTAIAVAMLVHSLVLGEHIIDIFQHWLDGCRNMFSIILILILAWSIGDICNLLETGTFVASLFDSNFDPTLLPLFTFLFAAGISFATGTSFATMSILVPIVTPLVTPFIGEQPDILYASIGSVLGGAIFGDHCSPISDTTILSSGASGCPVVEHVRTQLPYALLIGGLSCLCLILIPFLPVSAIVLNLLGMIVSAGLL